MDIGSLVLAFARAPRIGAIALDRAVVDAGGRLRHQATGRRLSLDAGMR